MQETKLTIPTMKPAIISKEMVKPSSATPNHLRSHSLCFFEQLNSTVYVPFVYFYNPDTPQTDIAHKISLLKFSLSESLSKYYPLAGRIKDNVTIDCNDEGIEFFQARSEFNLYDFLKHPTYQSTKLLIPEDPVSSSLFIVQVTLFACGGMALAFAISHKLVDMASLCSFINNWAATARNSSKNRVFSPLFNLSSLYPPIELPVMAYDLPEQVKCVSKRLVFDSSSIAKLRAIVKQARTCQVLNPSRVEVVTAQICRSSILAAAAISGSLKPSIWHHSMHMRSRLNSPLTDSTFGCLTGIFPVSTGEKADLELAELVNSFRKEKIKFQKGMNELEMKELYSFILKNSEGVRDCKNKNVYMCSSWCGFGLYEADFGWGKAVWVTCGSLGARNIVNMMDTKEGDGIEVYVTLEEKEMTVFEHDKELLSFAKFDPSPPVNCLQSLL